MLFPYERQIQEIGGRLVINPVGTASIAAFELRVRRTERRLALAGISVEEAITAALRRR